MASTRLTDTRNHLPHYDECPHARAPAARSRDPLPGSEPGADGSRYPRRAPDESAGVHRAGNLRADAAARPGLHAALPRRDAGGPQRNAHPYPGRRLLEGTISVGLLRPPVTAGGPVVEVLRHEPLVALLPVTYPRATQINLELTDLRTSRSSATPAHRPPRSARQSSVPAVRPDSPRGSARRPASPPSLVALVAAGLGAALAPASVRQLRTNGVTRRPLRRPAQATVMLAVAYKKGPVSP